MTFPTKQLQSYPEPPRGFTGITQVGDLWVTNDYFMHDGIRMPLDALEAEALVKANPGWNIPTPSQVDAIWQAARIKLEPKPISPWSDANTTLKMFIRHHEYIERVLDDTYDTTHNMLIAGHKKDVVLGRKRGRVAIYGWHRRNGEPIQPLSNIHGELYKDYSHGVRLVIPA